MHGVIAVRTSDSQLREPGFESSCCCFEAWTISFSLRCLTSLSCIIRLDTDNGGDIQANERTVFAQ